MVNSQIYATVLVWWCSPQEWLCHWLYHSSWNRALSSSLLLSHCMLAFSPSSSILTASLLCCLGPYLYLALVCCVFVVCLCLDTWCICYLCRTKLSWFIFFSFSALFFLPFLFPSLPSLFSISIEHWQLLSMEKVTWTFMGCILGQAQQTVCLCVCLAWYKSAWISRWLLFCLDSLWHL